MNQHGMTALVLCIVLLATACARGDEEQVSERLPAGDTTYVFDRPDASFHLPKDLEEISGLALLDDGRLAAIQDEDGILFVIEPSSGEIAEEYEFGKKGDYEAIEVMNGEVYVLRSDGRLIVLDGVGDHAEERATFELDLPKRCDAEGFRYDNRAERFLVSCKDEPGPGLEVEKAIYAFSPDGERLHDEPAYVIDSRRLNASLSDHPVNEAVRSVLSDKVDLSGFKPSEIAFHPISGELFVLSSVRETIIALDADGNPTAFWALPGDLLNQPEGMVFLPNGDLFIASEAGNQDRAVLLRFNFRGRSASTQ